MLHVNVAVLLFATATVQTIKAEGIRGRVFSESGEGVNGVLVSSMPKAETKTDQAGQFILQKSGELVRFSAPGIVLSQSG